MKPCLKSGRKHAPIAVGLALSLAAAALQACATAQPNRTSTPLLSPIVTVKYIVGSAADVVTYVELVVWEDGSLSTGLTPSPHCTTAPSQDIRGINALLKSSRVQAALSAHRVTPAANQIAPASPTLLIFSGDATYSFAPSEVSAPVDEFLVSVDDIFAHASCKFPPPAIEQLLHP
jgi:hypothetical protein